VKYICPLIVVSDIKVSRNFYENILGQKVKNDFGENILFEGDFAIHLKEHYLRLIGKDSNHLSEKSNNFELYFEEDDLEKLYGELKKHKVEFIHEIVEQPWGQKVMRFYDPDYHIIEVGAPIE